MRRDGFGQIVDEIKRASKKSLADYLNPPKECEQRTPLAVRQPSSVPLRCRHCREWMPKDSARLGRCLACGIPFSGSAANERNGA